MKKIVLILNSFFVFNLFISAQNAWIPKSPMNDNGRYTAVCFVINNKAYVGLGQAPGGTYLKDFWEYDPLVDTWTKKADYPGTGSYAASAFVINNKGYVCLGAANPTTNANDLWEYSPGSNIWVRKSDFPGTARYGASSFVIGDTAFVGTGSYGDPNAYMFDMWMYIPATDSWTRISDFPGGKRLHATAFTIGSYGYLGTGLFNNKSATSDFWKYNKSNDTWTPIPNLPGMPRMGVTSFVANNRAFVGTGYDFTRNYNDFYEYNSVLNSWDSLIKAPDELLGRRSPISFAIDNIGYLGTGLSVKGQLSDLWSFTTVNDVISDSILVRCNGNSPLTLNAWNTYITNYRWSTGDTVAAIQVTDEGLYKVTVTTNAGYELSDSVKVIVNNPVVYLGIDRMLCNSDSLVLDAGEQFTKFLWSTPNSVNTNRIVIASTTGIYSVEATNKYGCKARDTIKLSFIEKPRLDLTKLDTLYCGVKSAELVLSADKGNYTLQRVDNGEIFTGLNAIVPEFGSYSFRFTATDSLGCFRDTTFRVGFHPIPLVDLTVDSIKCYHYNLDVEYIGDAQIDASHFTWVFGGDTIADGIGLDKETIALGINRTKRDLSLKVTWNGCSNADTVKNIKVIPNLDLYIADSIVCMQQSAEFTAVNTESVIYDWDFGDGVTERSDNHVFHNYNNPGYYNVGLKVTTDKGCYNNVLIDSMVHIAPIPTAGFSLDPQKCLSLGDHEISYLGTGDQLDTYNWDLSAFDPDEIVTNPGITQGPFVFDLKNKPKATVKLSVVSKYGCKSDTAGITLKRIPDFSMKVYNNKGCIPLETGFEGIINDPVDQLFFTWDYGDGTTGNGGYTTHFYHDPDQKYNITLTALSALTKCSDITKSDSLVFAYPKPKADFTVDNSIVYNDKPDVQFLNQSSGANNYTWDFGDGATSIEENPLHKYRSVGYHKALLQVYNEYLCTDTVSRQVLVAFAKIFPPNAFSPNAPNPVDREFRLGQEAIKQEGYHLIIFSRWGDIVFEIKNEIKGWNGRMLNGNYAPVGNYVWILDFIDFLGRPHRQTGTVTLIL